MKRQIFIDAGFVLFAMVFGAFTAGGVFAAPVVQYSWDLDTNPGWAMEGEWEFGQPQGLGGDSFGYPDPTTGATGTNVFGINLNGDFALEELGPLYLTTGAIDCSSLTQVSLHFQRWLNCDWWPWAKVTVEVSTDGLIWTELWTNGSAEIADSAWSEQVFDLSTIADNQATVYLRWSHEITQASGAWAYSGWNIDDVEIHGDDSTGTVTAGLGCDPASGQLPFSFAIQVQLGNATGENRRMAGRIDVATGGGNLYTNWRSGFTNMSAGELFSTTWSQNMPAVAALVGDNLFTLQAEDVTPAPYNQPPYLPSGDSATVQCTVTGMAP